MSDFRPIPGHAGYAISPRGEVRSERGGYVIRLTHDERGRVCLRRDGKIGKFYVGELLAEAGFFYDREALARAEEVAADALRRLKLAETDNDNLRGSLDKARKANGLLLGIRDTLNRRIAELEAGARPAPAKRGGKPSAPKPEGVLGDLDAPWEEA